MHPLNPFLRAFFRSTLPAQCTPVQNHILLVPTTQTLLSSRDRESNVPYADLAGSEEFLGSHVLRLPGSALSSGAKDAAGSIRDSRGKAKQFTTVNGRTVVVKDAAVYSNKGFKNLNQAHLLGDVLWYPDALDAQQWLIYFISKPLIGTLEPVPIVPAALPDRSRPALPPRPEPYTSPSSSAQTPQKKEIKTFNDLLNSFPMIARQMQSGLEGVFREFGEATEKPVSQPAPAQASELDGPTPVGSLGPGPSSTSTNGSLSNGHAKAPAGIQNSYAGDDQETIMRGALETAVTAAIDLFQLVDKQQLSLLGATTELTGPLVERLIERYVTEQVHDSIVFPRMCAIKRQEDQELEYRIRQMESVDIAQVGIPIRAGMQGKRELILRLQKAVETFRRLGVAGSPQEMIEILLETEKAVTMASAERAGDGGRRGPTVATEKPKSDMTINADVLVSLLLIVVIRSQVRHLHARLSYMRHFIFLDDAEGGEIGYALSTFEAVLSYLAKDSGGLRKASRRNKALWQATREGRLKEMKSILQPSLSITGDEYVVEEPEEVETRAPDELAESTRSDGVPGDVEGQDHSCPDSLSHVFLFQVQRHNEARANDAAVRSKRKRVSMDTGSMSSSSGYSCHSRTTTLDSRGSGIEGDTSIERLSQTQDPAGESVPMMAIESRQPESLAFLLGLDEYYSLDTILEDSNSEGTTLLSAAVQVGRDDLTEIVLDFVFRAEDDQVIRTYLERQDNRGRTVGHYLFNAPHLLDRLGRLLPWRLKDKNGQTPLFALCRSYDHPRYRDMIGKALAAAQASQADGLSLHLDDHVDGKGNTLLHAVNDPQLASHLMEYCDTDVNATNDKRFTPLMVASKYGRLDMVRTLFGDPRVDLYAKELRGLTAVELAKDDEIRNRIDDLILLSDSLSVDGRTTAVVRSFFVEDATIRLVLKSAAPSSALTITITTCRRSLADFENLAKWLSIEHPASWLPPILDSRSPFQIASKPSRAVLRDIQQRLDAFLKVLLAHSTFATHEMLWEFFLAPEIQPEMMAERSKKKAEMRLEMVKDEYAPAEDVRDVELFVGHARDAIRGVNHSTKSVVRRANTLRTISSDLSDAQLLASRALSTVLFLPPSHVDAMARYSATLMPTEMPPYAFFHADLQCIGSTIAAMLGSLARPSSLISSMTMASKAIDRHMSSLRRSDRWPLGLLDDTRNKIHREAADKVEASRQELLVLGSELRYTQQTVAGELAAWQDLHAKMARRALRGLAQRMVTVEKARLESMRRAVRGVVGEDKLRARRRGTESPDSGRE
ncbi:MAG: hypothetical protein M1832_000151 [Thelocarpon impressellum]|nr:MAG: hypothetical protein M1832_000151 [Thelocarpon impressellum]